MASVNYRKAVSAFDSFDIDVPAIWQDFPPSPEVAEALFGTCCSLGNALYRSPLLPVKLRVALWTLLNKTHFDTIWLEKFNAYWTGVLKRRPILGVLDFAFLLGVHRRIFYDYQVVNASDPQSHLDLFQRPELVYALLLFVYKESLVNFYHCISLGLKYGKPNGSVLEFGAALAPVVNSYLRFGAGRKRKFVISDLETIYFHYGCMKLACAPNVRYEILKPDNNFMLNTKDRFDIIYCIEVFEHLHEPLRIARMFYDLMNPGGILIFDYVKSDGQGLDTHVGLEERPAVLDFITRNFEVMEGSLDNPQASLAMTVVKKK